jgi:hypothetical protein
VPGFPVQADIRHLTRIDLPQNRVFAWPYLNSSADAQTGGLHYTIHSVASRRNRSFGRGFTQMNADKIKISVIRVHLRPKNLRDRRGFCGGIL